MELWIRSQDKETLTKIDYVYLSVPTGKEVIGGNHYMLNKSLGIYNSKERALEVLDEIQSNLVGTFLLKAKDKEYEKIMPTAKKYFEDINNVSVITGDKNFDLVPINKDIFAYEMPEN